MGLQQIQRALALPPSFRQIPSSTGAILSPKGQGDNVQRHVAMHDWGRCHWHLVTGGVWTPYLYTTAPTKGDSAQITREVKDSCGRGQQP